MQQSRCFPFLSQWSAFFSVQGKFVEIHRSVMGSTGPAAAEVDVTALSMWQMNMNVSWMVTVV
jgi:hypothetical protein